MWGSLEHLSWCGVSLDSVSPTVGAAQPVRRKCVGLNGVCSSTKVISANLILRAEFELKIPPVATVTRVAGYGCLVDGDEEKPGGREERLEGKGVA